MASTRRFTLDIALHDQPPITGDHLAGPQAAYEILEVLPVDSKVWPNRWRLTVRRIGNTADHAAAIKDDQRSAALRGTRPTWRTFRTYRRGEGPAEFFGAA